MNFYLSEGSLGYVKLLSVGLWLLFCLLVSLNLVAGEWGALVMLLTPLVIAIISILDLRALVLLMLLGMPTLFIFPNNVLSQLPFMRVERVLIILIIGRMIFTHMWQKQSTIRFTTLEKLILAFFIVLILSFLTTVVGKDMTVIRKDIAFLILGYLMPLSSFMLARRLAWDDSYLKSLMFGCVALGLYLTVTGILQYFFGINWFTPIYLEHQHQLTRVAGAFGNPTEYGSVQVICLIITLWAYTGTTDKLKQFGLLICALVIFGGLAMSLTRAPWVGLIAALVFLFFMDRRVRPVFLAVIAFSFVVVLIALPWLMDTKIFEPEHFVARLSEMDSIYNRVVLYATSLNMMIQNPILGIGFGSASFKNQIFEYIISIGSVSAQYGGNVGVPHNEYLHIGVLSGITGLILFLSILVLMFRNLKLVENMPLLPDHIRYAALYIRAALLSFCVAFLFVDAGLLSYIGIFIFSLAGVVLSFQEKQLKV